FRVGGIILAVLLLVGGVVFWNHYKNKKLQELAYKEYEISKLVRAGNYAKAKEVISSASSKDSPFKPLFLSYSLYMSTYVDEKIDEGKVTQEMIKSLKDRELLSLYRERYAYYLFKQGKTKEALKELDAVGEKDFNWASAMLLKAQILKKEGRHKEAEEVLNKIKEKSSQTYFANMAQAIQFAGE
ncbi:MAG: tetratricopeptide repeat protein, partial [Aquificaceae bacterium]|nr:tetratricopeptide repeat protein [Aquificaceae bacterium]